MPAHEVSNDNLAKAPNALKIVNGAPNPFVDGSALKTDKPKSITITLDPKDAALYTKIVADAENDDRSPAKLLLIYLRNNYKVS